MLNYNMKYFATLLVCFFILTSCSQTYYVVRHAEKDTSIQGDKDPALSEAGKQRAENLREILKDDNIAYAFATNTVRTKSTAQPTSDFFHINIRQYSKIDSAFFVQLKKLKKNVLIVGHSNTVKNIVNGLCGEDKIKTDLRDDEFDNLFVITYKRFFMLHIKLDTIKY